MSSADDIAVPINVVGTVSSMNLSARSIACLSFVDLPSAAKSAAIAGWSRFTLYFVSPLRVMYCCQPSTNARLFR